MKVIWGFKGAAFGNQDRGNHIISTNFEHPAGKSLLCFFIDLGAVKEVLEYLKTKGFEVTYVNVDAEGLISVKVNW